MEKDRQKQIRRLRDRLQRYRQTEIIMLTETDGNGDVHTRDRHTNRRVMTEVQAASHIICYSRQTAPGWVMLGVGMLFLVSLPSALHCSTLSLSPVIVFSA